jgi:hypothetical protein
LVETLAALAALGLAMGGLAMGVQLLAREQSATGAVITETSDRRRAQAAVDRLLGPLGPFRSQEPQRLTGDSQQITFECGDPEPCRIAWIDSKHGLEVELRSHGEVMRTPLHAAAPGRFVYESGLGQAPAWPPPGPERTRLRSIALISSAKPDEALIKARLWIEQPVACAFDTVLRDCR